MSYFAAALARAGDGWTAYEVDLDDVETIDDLVDVLGELQVDAETTVLFVEEDDEYVGIVRVDSGADDARVFLSDGRAADTFGIAEVLADGVEVIGSDEDEPIGRDAEPLGDAALLTDLGVSSARLLDLVASDGRLPADVISAVCEKVGCLDELESIREV